MAGGNRLVAVHSRIPAELQQILEHLGTVYGRRQSDLIRTLIESHPVVVAYALSLYNVPKDLQPTSKDD